MAADRRRLIPPMTAATIVFAGSVGTLLLPAPASAADDFGQHVAVCAKDMGFTGDHNPGMHQGRAGWDREAQC